MKKNFKVLVKTLVLLLLMIVGISTADYSYSIQESITVYSEQPEVDYLQLNG